MRAQLSAALFATAVAAFATFGAANAIDQETAPLVLRGLDPVELVAGKETRGSTAIVVERGGYRYGFANVENRRTFESDPERYAAQFGGACMKMGPLSGSGDGDRFTVFEGRIYIHASDTCQTSFRANPKKFVDRADEPPTGTAEQAELARQWLAKAAVGMGGGERLSKLSTLQILHRLTQRVRDREIPSTRLQAIQFPATLAFHEDYGDSAFGWLLTPEAGYLSWENGKTVERDVREVMIRELYRNPAVVLKAWQEGRATAFHQGQGKSGETPVERVAVAVHGATTTFGIDPASGRILEAAYRGRAAVGIGEIVLTYSDFRQVGGLVPPFGVSTALDGAPLKTLKVAVDSIKVDEAIPQNLLTPPTPAAPTAPTATAG